MIEVEPLAAIVAVACSGAALLLAWRAFRAASDLEARKREKEGRDIGRDS